MQSLVDCFEGISLYLAEHWGVGVGGGKTVCSGFVPLVAQCVENMRQEFRQLFERNYLLPDRALEVKLSARDCFPSWHSVQKNNREKCIQETGVTKV